MPISETTPGEMPARIMMMSGGKRVPRLAAAPLLASYRSGWKGLRMERHLLASPAEGTGVIDGYQICYNLTGPVPLRWRIPGGWSSGILNRGDLCLATHGEFRSVSWQRSYQLLLLSLSPQLMAETSEPSRQRHNLELQSRHGFRDPHIATICRLLQADLGAGTPAGPLYGEQLATALATYLTQQYAVEKAESPAKACKLPGLLLHRVCDFIDARLDAPIGLNDLAREANLSRFHFARLFRNSTGQSPYQYLMERRIERAKEMLAAGKWSGAEVAQKAGFSSQSHLALLFRRYTGMGPAEFRSCCSQ